MNIIRFEISVDNLMEAEALMEYFAKERASVSLCNNVVIHGGANTEKNQKKHDENTVWIDMNSWGKKDIIDEFRKKYQEFLESGKYNLSGEYKYWAIEYDVVYAENKQEG